MAQIHWTYDFVILDTKERDAVDFWEDYGIVGPYGCQLVKSGHRHTDISTDRDGPVKKVILIVHQLAMIAISTRTVLLLLPICTIEGRLLKNLIAFDLFNKAFR